jgi:hypothetical protein
MPSKAQKMRIFFFLITLVVTAGFFISGVVMLLARAIGQLSLNPQSAAWKRTLAKLRERIRKQADKNLIPWDAEMLGLLSTNRTIIKKPGFFDLYSEGMYSTIYQEPVLVYAALKTGKTSVLVASTSDREFVFRQKDKEIEIWLNEQPLGLFVDGTLLAPGRGSKLLARMEGGTEASLPVLIGDKTAAAITNPEQASGPNPRALTLLRTLDLNEENALLALTILKMTKL